MGCDVHMIAEVLDSNSGNWILSGQKTYDESYMSMPRIYTGRNYDLFGILADVRNGRGFAGVETGEGFDPICEQRGIPNDASAEYQEWCDSWGEDGHSHSWILLSELDSYDWDQVSTLYGTIPLFAKDSSSYESSNFETWRATRGCPKTWCGSISGRDVLTVSEKEAEMLLKHPENAVPNIKYYTTVKWQESYREAAGKSWWDTVDKLRYLGEPEKVRIVFFFDN